MLAEEELKSAKLLVFANKQDLPNKASASEVSEKLGLDQLKDRSWTIQGCCATKGEGLEEGLDWWVHLTWVILLYIQGPKILGFFSPSGW